MLKITEIKEKDMADEPQQWVSTKDEPDKIEKVETEKEWKPKKGFYRFQTIGMIIVLIYIAYSLIYPPIYNAIMAKRVASQTTLNVNAKNGNTTKKAVTAKAFEKIRLGMSYSDAKKILGNYTGKTDFNTGSKSGLEYDYSNADGTFAAIYVLDDKVVGKFSANLVSGTKDVTQEQIDSLNTGMTEKEVTDILGGGETAMDVETDGDNMKTLVYASKTGGDWMIMFQDGAMTTVSQSN